METNGAGMTTHIATHATTTETIEMTDTMSAEMIDTIGETSVETIDGMTVGMTDTTDVTGVTAIITGLGDNSFTNLFTPAQAGVSLFYCIILSSFKIHTNSAFRIRSYLTISHFYMLRMYCIRLQRFFIFKSGI